MRRMRKRVRYNYWSNRFEARRPAGTSAVNRRAAPKVRAAGHNAEFCQ